MMDWLIGWLTSSNRWWLVADRIGTLLSYVTLATVVLAAVQFVRFLRRFRAKRRLLQRLGAGETARPYALAVSFRGPIGPAVEAFLATAYPGVTIPIVEYFRSEDVTAQNVHSHEEGLWRLKEELQLKAVTEVHLFVQAPLVIGTILGALLDNFVAVKLYQYNQGKYEAWTYLHSVKERTLRRTLEEAVARAIAEPDVALPEPPPKPVPPADGVPT